MIDSKHDVLKKCFLLCFPVLNILFVVHRHVGGLENLGEGDVAHRRIKLARVPT